MRHVVDCGGRRITLIAILMCYSLASLLLAFTLEGNWAYLSVFRAGVGLGVGGDTVNIALAQEIRAGKTRLGGRHHLDLEHPAGCSSPRCRLQRRRR